MFRDSVYLDCGVLGLTLCSLVVVRSTQKLEALCFKGTFGNHLSDSILQETIKFHTNSVNTFIWRYICL